MQMSYHRNNLAQEKCSPQMTALSSTMCHHSKMDFEQPTLHLASWRRQSKISQEKLADKIGYARGYIAKCETQSQNVTLEFLTAFAEGVGAPNVQALFSSPSRLNPEAHELLEFFEGIEDEQDRASVLSVARSLSIKEGSGNAGGNGTN